MKNVAVKTLENDEALSCKRGPKYCLTRGTPCRRLEEY